MSVPVSPRLKERRVLYREKPISSGSKFKVITNKLNFFSQPKFKSQPHSPFPGKKHLQLIESLYSDEIMMSQKDSIEREMRSLRFYSPRGDKQETKISLRVSSNTARNELLHPNIRLKPINSPIQTISDDELIRIYLARCKV